MKRVQLPKKFLKALHSVKAKRPRTVIEHILRKGHITTEELEQKYGYRHAPRAARDVRECGIPLETFFVKAGDGRRIAAYRFKPEGMRQGTLSGRKAISKALKSKLLDQHGSKCAICLKQYEAQHLQVDHRVPFEIGGETPVHSDVMDDYMPICGSCNRAKSWSCEHCPNWREGKSVEICLACYWASPGEYKHIGLREIRRVDVVWSGEEVRQYEKLKQLARNQQRELPDFVRVIVGKYLET